MKPTRDLDPKLLRQVLAYNPETGDLSWRERPLEMFTNKDPIRIGRAWNAKNAGKRAFTAINQNGYLCGAVTSVFSLAHRVAWAIYHGETPGGFIDHINGDKTDNRIANLRVVDARENRRNCPRRKNNTSGVQGVCWAARKRMWTAYITINSKVTNLGGFQNFEDAVAARQKAEAAHGYHPNHGRENASAA